MAEESSMISRSIPPVPKGDAELRRWLEKILREHYEDIHTLFSLCTDCDQLEKLRRDQESL